MRPVYAKETFVSVLTRPNWSPTAAFPRQASANEDGMIEGRALLLPLVETLVVNGPLSSSNAALALLCVMP